MLLSSNLGYPRIGPNRELKWLLESFWKKKINQISLFENISNIKKDNWIKQRKAGIHFIPSNDFSLYDHVLDMCLTVDAVPDRFKKLKNKKEILELYFAMARGYQKGRIDIKAMEMTKWFDTNYHYIVPEFKPNQKFKLAFSKIIDEFLEAKNFGIKTRPVILGPLSFLFLGKSTSNKFNRFNLLTKLGYRVRMVGVDLSISALQNFRDILKDKTVGAEIRAEGKHVILDEAQDTDPGQFEVLTEIARPESAQGIWLKKGGIPPGTGRFCMVGDPQQSIYGSRTDLNFYQHVHKKLLKDAQGEELFFKVTFRCDEKIVEGTTITMTGNGIWGN